VPTYDQVIQNLTRGNTKTIRRNITDLDVTDPLVKAWFTAKLDPESEADVDAVIGPKEITTANVIGTGRIEADGGAGTGDGTATVRFDIVAADSLAMAAGVEYKWSIKGLTNGGALTTPNDGSITAREQVTRDAT